MAAPGWPAVLRDGDVGLRPLRLRDAPAWSEVRLRNEQWLTRWEGRPPTGALQPWQERHTTAAFTLMARIHRREARDGRTLPFALTVQGRLAGQVTVSSIVRGAFQSGSVGYWVDEREAGRGVVTTAVALVLDHCFGPVGLHRVEASVRPENTPSLRVVAKLGMRPEGLRERLLFIDEAWRDHLSFALDVQDQPEGVLRRLRSRHTG